MPEIRTVDVHDDKALTAWYDALRAGATAQRRAPLLQPYSAMAGTFRNPGPAKRRIPVAALDGGDTVGAMLVDFPLMENLTSAEVEINVPPELRGRGVGGALWQWGVEYTDGEGRPVVHVEIHVPDGQAPMEWPGARFALRRGFVSVNVEDHLVLPLPAVAPTALSPEPEKALPGRYELVRWAGVCPDDQLDALAAMRTVMSQDVPSGEAAHETVRWDAERLRVNEERMARSYLSLVCLVRTTAGEPAGYTQILLAHDDAENAIQDDTFVARSHRGQRLSALLKAANLEQLERHRGGRRLLHTWTSELNPAMQKVNAGFGFRAVEQTHIYQRDGSAETAQQR